MTDEVGSVDMLSIRSEHTLRSENLPFDIDVWYPQISQFTYKTVFLPLKKGEARALVNYYKNRYIEVSKKR